MQAIYANNLTTLEFLTMLSIRQPQQQRTSRSSTIYCKIKNPTLHSSLGPKCLYLPEAVDQDSSADSLHRQEECYDKENKVS